MTIFLLGHRGMLGHVVLRYLREAGHEVLVSDLRYGGTPRDPLVTAAAASGATWVVNAIAALPGASADALHLVNERLPLHLAMDLAPGQRLLHASTDGVYSGERGARRPDEPADAVDPYGFSKRLGEACLVSDRAYVLRTSIIGPTPCGTRGLLSWALGRDGAVTGYANHFWNGVTTLEWARVCDEICRAHLAPTPLMHVASAERVSKADLLQAIYRAWDRDDVLVHPVDASPAVDRSLHPTISRPEIARQLQELRVWYPA